MTSNVKILNFGSLNLDYVYSVPHIVKPGETISSTDLEIFCGGKGLNQSIALSKAGANVFHAGLIGADGFMLLDTLTQAGVDVSYVNTIDTRTGNAIIQVDMQGENCIVLFGGANQQNTKNIVDSALSNFATGDWLLLQNEVNLLSYLIDKAYDAGMNIALNPSPFNDIVSKLDLSKISLFLLNEVEGEQLTGENNADKILDVLRKLYPLAGVVLTLGKQGSIYQDSTQRLFQKAHSAEIVDTTAAGDTFTGYFITAIIRNENKEEALRLASSAAAIAVSRMGASTSIPTMEEVLEYSHK